LSKLEQLHSSLCEIINISLNWKIWVNSNTLNQLSANGNSSIPTWAKWNSFIPIWVTSNSFIPIGSCTKTALKFGYNHTHLGKFQQPQVEFG